MSMIQGVELSSAWAMSPRPKPSEKKPIEFNDVVKSSGDNYQLTKLGKRMVHLGESRHSGYKYTSNQNIDSAQPGDYLIITRDPQNNLALKEPELYQLSDNQKWRKLELTRPIQVLTALVNDRAIHEVSLKMSRTNQNLSGEDLLNLQKLKNYFIIPAHTRLKAGDMLVNVYFPDKPYIVKEVDPRLDDPNPIKLIRIGEHDAVMDIQTYLYSLLTVNDLEGARSKGAGYESLYNTLVRPEECQ